MAFAKKLFGGLLGTLTGGLLGRKPKIDVPAAPLSASRDDAREAAERETALARRRGARADRVAGGGNMSGASIGRFVAGS